MAALHPRKTLACALSPICLVPVRTRLHRRLSGGVRDYLILCCAVDAGEWRRDGGWSWIGGAYTRGGRLGDASLQPDTADRQIFHISCLVDGCPDGRLSWKGGIRSEERRVGKQCVGTCSSRWSRDL